MNFSRPKPLLAPLMLWVAVQLAALCVAASGVKLSAHFVSPPQRLALVAMIVAQFAAAAMLFPFLLPSARACASLMLTSAPMLLLAAMLARKPVGVAIGAWTCLALWLVAWTIVRASTLKRERAMALAVANVVGVGGMFLWYVAIEFGSARWPTYLPMVSVVRFVSGWEALTIALGSNVALVVAALVWSSVRPRKH